MSNLKKCVNVFIYTQYQCLSKIIIGVFLMSCFCLSLMSKFESFSIFYL